MDIGRFDKPVKVMIGRPGRIRVVSSTREAAECLLQRWPIKGGDKHLEARKVCFDVIGGWKDAEAAREAFEVAADEAGILVP